jgi:hypothetical protein
VVDRDIHADRGLSKAPHHYLERISRGDCPEEIITFGEKTGMHPCMLTFLEYRYGYGYSRIRSPRNSITIASDQTTIAVLPIQNLDISSKITCFRTHIYRTVTAIIKILEETREPGTTQRDTLTYSIFVSRQM